MRIIENKRGQARVIEAFLASLLLISCLTLIPAPPRAQNSTGSILSTAQNILLSLDSNGHLATLIDNRNWTALQDSVEASLPLTGWFNLTVLNKDMNILNPFPICNAGAVSDKVVSVDYVCASQGSTYTIYVLRLQLSEVGLT
jgi:hypothetical protein